MNSNSEIRKLPVSARLKLSSIFEVNDAWKHLMSIIPLNKGTEHPKKYTFQQIKAIEDEAKRRSQLPFYILIDEWGTSGKERATIQDLIDLSIKIDNFQAADYLLVEVLGKDHAVRPKQGLAASIPLNSDVIHSLQQELNLEFQEARNVVLSTRCDFTHHSNHHTENPEPEEFATILPHLSYTELEYITDNFNLVSVTQNGRKLGAGAFGTVFLGDIPNATPEDAIAVQIFNKKLNLPLKSKVAVKRLHTQKIELDIDIHSLFRKEVEVMSHYLHENLLKLLAYSCNGPDYCLVYPYMCNGSLEARLACEGGSAPLQWNQRLDISHGVAAALVHLHTAGDQPLVHRDVKSANVLLDDHMKPKLGDFGLIRFGASGRSKSVALTSNVLGTSAYMAPEAFRGDISIKLDTFSFGVILLELLTGLPPYEESRDGNDLISHIDAALDEKAFIQLLDSRVPPLPEDMANELHGIALACIQEKKKRPIMNEVLAKLLNVDKGNNLM